MAYFAELTVLCCPRLQYLPYPFLDGKVKPSSDRSYRSFWPNLLGWSQDSTYLLFSLLILDTHVSLDCQLHYWKGRICRHRSSVSSSSLVLGDAKVICLFRSKQPTISWSTTVLQSQVLLSQSWLTCNLSLRHWLVYSVSRPVRIHHNKVLCVSLIQIVIGWKNLSNEFVSNYLHLSSHNIVDDILSRRNPTATSFSVSSNIYTIFYSANRL